MARTARAAKAKKIAAAAYVDEGVGSLLQRLHYPRPDDVFIPAGLFWPRLSSFAPLPAACTAPESPRWILHRDRAFTP
jgi:hypothetical protein